ncbi:MAG TPA: adenylosuccinate lyase, partial [bacterium]|nr:adenylosuccinate lyase [bacterium]
LWHERDITHSSVERVIIPDSTILLDYMLTQFIRVVDKLIVYPENMMRNIERSKGLIFSQPVLLALAKKGLKREEAYKIVQTTAMAVWETPDGNFKKAITTNAEVTSRLSKEEIDECFDLKHSMKHIGYLFERAGIKS